MGMRVRMGPFSVSSRGRVGVSVGPVGVYGGGHRRRRSTSGGGGGLWAFFGVMLLIGLAVVYWYVAVPLLAIVVGVVVWASRANAKRAREQAERQAHTQHELDLAQQARRRAWLAAPPTPLPMPGRFTQTWIVANAPHLHPGQVPMLLRELNARGWTDQRIDDRVRPYLPSDSSAAPPAV